MPTDPNHYTRRNFVKTAAGAAVIGSLASAPQATLSAADDAAPKPATPLGRPRIGCVSWVFHGFGKGADPEPAIEQIGKLGFEGVELILNVPGDIKDFWTPARIDAIKKRLDANKLQVAQFDLFQPVVGGLTSTKADERQRNLDNFEAGCRIGRQFNSPIVCFVAPWPRELRGPGYLPRYYEVADAKPGVKFHIDVAPEFDWDRLWQNFVDTIRACLERAKAHGMKLTIEHHTHTMIHDATAFLRLWDAIRDPALGINLDVGWTASQREYPPVAIHKVKRHLMNLHMRDIDGMMRNFVHVGHGVMDFRAIVDTLKAVGFNGFMNLEQDNWGEDMAVTCRRYVAMMKEYLGA